MAAATDPKPRHPARAIADSPAFQAAVRAGFVARGLTYALIGALAIALAVGAGSGGEAPNQQGALDVIASAPLGAVALAAIAVGLGAYALWKLFLAAFGVGPEGAGGTGLRDRLANLVGGVVYLAFCGLAVRVLIGSAGSQASEQRRTTAGVLGWPGGRELVGAAGLILFAICAEQIWEAVKGSFAHDNKTAQMGPEERRVFMLAGRMGLIARSLVFAVSAYFLIRTAVNFHVSGGIGVDGALSEVHHQPFGNVLLAVAGAGLLIFAGFSVLEARRRRL